MPQIVEEVVPVMKSRVSLLVPNDFLLNALAARKVTRAMMRTELRLRTILAVSVA